MSISNISSMATMDVSFGASAPVKSSCVSSLRIEDVPTFDLTKVEFLEKLGEGKFFLTQKC